MSSDSDDDYCYTNAVSRLKALTKNDTSINSDIETKSVDFFDTSDTNGIRTTKRNLRKAKVDSFVIDDDLNQSDDCVEELIKNNNSCVVLSDEEVHISTPCASSPVNIISAIDDVLKSKKGRKKGKRKAAPTSRQTRSNKRTKYAKVLPSTEICLVDDSPDVNDINYEVTVKVYWRSQNLEKFTMKRLDKLTNIFQHFSQKENIAENRLLFTIKDKVVTKNDTPNSLSITAATIIEGGILSGNSDLVSKIDDDMREFKVQTRDRKRPLLISLKPEDKMEVLMCQCAQELDVPMKKLKFYFDGDLIRSNDTPETLDLEGGEIIDCIR